MPGSSSPDGVVVVKGTTCQAALEKFEPQLEEMEE